MAGPPRRRSTATRQPASDRVASALRTELVEGHVKSGTQINQDEWGGRLGVSRAALREGLKALATEGLLTYDPHRGYFVTHFAMNELAQLYWLRMVIERTIIESIRAPDEGEMQRLAHSHKLAVDAFAVGDVTGCIGADREFFFGIYDLSPLTFLRNEAQRLWDLASGLRSAAMVTAVSQEGFERRFRDNHARQFDALVHNDRLLLADLVVSERRAMIETWTNEEFGSRLLFSR